MRGNVEAVYCELKYSGVGIGLLGTASIATLAMVSLTPFDGPLRVALDAWIVAMALRAMRAMRAVRWLRLDAARILHVGLQGGREATGVARDGSFVAPWLTLVRWRPEGGWFDRTLLILPGMAGAEEFRRLRVLLRWS